MNMDDLLEGIFMTAARQTTDGFVHIRKGGVM
jgi:hypothetical protein